MNKITSINPHANFQGNLSQITKIKTPMEADPTTPDQNPSLN